MIPVDQIHVLNPRSRNKAKFQEIVGNIARVGLKKPITVAPREGPDGGYDLVCGQGRLEAFIALEQKEIPAIVRELPKEDRYLMSLVENLARRSHASMELVRQIQVLRDRGSTHAQIAEKVGTSDAYISMLLRLADNGEERLVQAVERGEIPIAVATEIASSEDASMQQALADAYTSGKLRGKALLTARRLVEVRSARGKALNGGNHQKTKTRATSDQLVAAYRREAQRQQLKVRKARVCETRIVFIAGALKRLFQDENFVTLLRAESLETMPEYLASSVAKAVS
jgi:ParB family chromosome partitioning protein